MPRFAANLSMMYVEQPFLDRFAAAAADGFEAVEFLFPYEWPADTLAATLKQTRPAAGAVQRAAGRLRRAASAASPACPAARPSSGAASTRALDYAAALACPRVHVMAGLVPAGSRRARRCGRPT